MDGTDWAGPHQCCADFGAVLRTERTGYIMRCPACRFEWAVPFSDQSPLRNGLETSTRKRSSLSEMAIRSGRNGAGSVPRRWNNLPAI